MKWNCIKEIRTSLESETKWGTLSGMPDRENCLQRNYKPRWLMEGRASDWNNRTVYNLSFLTPWDNLLCMIYFIRGSLWYLYSAFFLSVWFTTSLSLFQARLGIAISVCCLLSLTSVVLSMNLLIGKRNNNCKRKKSNIKERAMNIVN